MKTQCNAVALKGKNNETKRRSDVFQHLEETLSGFRQICGSGLKKL